MVLGPEASVTLPAFRSIMHVNDNGGRFGGTEEYISLLTTGLGPRGVTSHLVCGAVAGEPPGGLDTVHVVDGVASRQPDPCTAPAVVRIAEALQPDVILLHNLFDAAIVSSLATRPNRGPLVWYVHDHFVTCLSELRWRRDRGACSERLGPACLHALDDGLCVVRHRGRGFDDEELARRTALAASLGMVDAVVVVSEYMRSLLAAQAPPLASRIHLLPRPVRNLGGTQPRHAAGGGGAAVVTFAGRITPEKGLAVLIRALGRVRTVRDIELRVAGVVENERYWLHCQELQRLAVAANPRLTVSNLGQLDYADTDELLRRSDIVAVPSQWPEPLGAVAIEAMAAGAAVVASDIGGLGTYLVDGRTGLLVDPDDVARWTGAIESLLRRPRWARTLGTAASRRAQSLTAEAHIDALDRLIRAAPGRGPEALMTLRSDRR